MAYRNAKDYFGEDVEVRDAKSYFGEDVSKSKSSQPKEPIVPEWGKDYPNAYGALGALYELSKPLAKPVGMAIGAAPGVFTGNPGMAMIGAGLGTAGGKNLTETLGNMVGAMPARSLPEKVNEIIPDSLTGSAEYAVGDIAAPVLSKVAKGIGSVGKQFLGKSTGAGPGSIEAAVNGGKEFTDALRGKVEPIEIIDNAKSALLALKEQRGQVYRTKLSQLTKDAPVDMTPLKTKVIRWLNNYRVGRNADGSLDFSNSKLPKEAALKVEEAYNDIMRWDQTPGNNTVIGLDTLKQRLGNYYSESSGARAAIADLKRSTHELITEQVPQYSDMTKGYHEASNLIESIEKSLMLGKDKTADQVLRRLSSSMRENFEMRKDLVDILGNKTAKDITGSISGYNLRPVLPKGLFAPLTTVGGFGYLAYLNPKFMPLLLTASPRVVGEFLNIFGKGLKESKSLSPFIKPAIKPATLTAITEANNE